MEMTFQEIVERMIREDSEEWVMDLLIGSGNMVNAAAEDIKFGNLPDGKLYFCNVSILNGFNIPIDSVEVSGKIINKVKHTQITHNGSTIWHDSRFIREDLGITEFEI